MTIEELARSAGTTVRTVRYYIAQGLLPGPGTRGKGTQYTEEHRLRLRLVRRLVEQRVPIAQIRDRLASMSLAEVRAVLAEQEVHRRSLDAAAARSPREYISALLRRASAARDLPPAAGLPLPTTAAAPRRRELQHDQAAESEVAHGAASPPAPPPPAPAAPATPRAASTPPSALSDVSGLLADGALPAPAAAPEPAADTWERIELAPGVELSVRADARRTYAHLVQLLVRVARAAPAIPPPGTTPPDAAGAASRSAQR